MNGHEPRWDTDVKYGAQGELKTMTLLEWVARGNGRTETKTKRRLDFELYIETECYSQRTQQYEPSGISKTEADVWIIQIAETDIGFHIGTSLLRESLKHPSVRRKEEKDGDHPTRGYLVNLAAVLETAKRLGVPA